MSEDAKSTASTARTIIRAKEEGERRWFFGGGVHTWKLTAEETNGALFAIEDELARGKTTPLHCHPSHDELVYVIAGELRYLANGEERNVTAGGTIFTPRGVKHAFVVVSESARMLFLQTPGDGEAFYREASEPITDAAGPVDFKKIAEAAKRTGITEVLGPPPFAPVKP